ncbi:LOW QUALITY PROTEIN: H-2 class II histocompatibility antigen, A-U alpha chain-like [Toxotes jaculatrix]|uniref:LOW QUALITY PROTEIN: H-2 class II histocompatibility antigen, A-U alpha chain-like n=1 Tax=Toxotes jaculatrix TaxID=941984 RepID=UPI001B3AE80F|nr:LOW QUALITY PROTEIN: H-2 class II histocompatibility antigen, A-U alpha chain-like [Toxotes jaculatrix]
MKTTMKVPELVLVLCCVLCVSADSLHEDLAIAGCSQTDGEYMYALDGEEVWYADFIHGKEVDPQPSFVDHVNYGEGAYEGAVAALQVCKQNLNTVRGAMRDIPLERDPPSPPMIYTRDDVELGEQNTLICHVTGFYPAPVNVTWTKNEEKVTEGTSINVPFPNTDGSFTQMSRLVFIPQLGDIYSCTVDHPALSQPLTRIWDVDVQQPGVGPAVFCGLGLTVGLLGVAAGTFFLIKGTSAADWPGPATSSQRVQIVLSALTRLDPLRLSERRSPPRLHGLTTPELL